MEEGADRRLVSGNAFSRRDPLRPLRLRLTGGCRRSPRASASPASCHGKACWKASGNGTVKNTPTRTRLPTADPGIAPPGTGRQGADQVKARGLALTVPTPLLACGPAGSCSSTARPARAGEQTLPRPRYANETPPVQKDKLWDHHPPSTGAAKAVVSTMPHICSIASSAREARID
jgi:hypothetical protein